MLWKLAKVGRDPVISFAADELARYLKIMDPRAEVPVFQYPEQDSQIPAIWLAVDPSLQAEVKDPAADDAYSISLHEGTGEIFGSNPRSVLLGVYRLLRELGCAWVRPGADGEMIPRHNPEHDQVSVREKASCRHRGICIEGSGSYEHVLDMIAWMPKMGFNAYFMQFHNPVNFYNRWYAHTANPLRKPEPLSAREVEALRDQTILEIKKRGLMYHTDGHGWTCEPFGLPGESWAPVDIKVPASSVRYLAKINGRRRLYQNVTLNTNLCYSNPTVRRKIADAVGKRCQQTPEIDYVQVWMADGINNHCECETCSQMRPSDWYMMLLNEIDARLTKLGLSTKVVFLMYLDLLWAPEKIRLNNPDRFVLMFAPITRTFSSSIADAPLFDEEKLSPYQRNRLQFPSSVSENLAHLRQWQAHFSGDSFDYDYYFGRGHYADPGYTSISRILFRDIQSLHSVGLNGLVSCQSQRVFLPSGLGMTAMAAALWDAQADYDEVAEKYYRDAFGPDGQVAAEYLQKITETFDPVYLRGEKPVLNPQAAERLGQIPALLDSCAGTIAAHAEDRSLPENVRQSWKYLMVHALLCRHYAEAFRCRALGDTAGTEAALKECYACAWEHEQEVSHVFDVFKFQAIVQGMLGVDMHVSDYKS